MGHINSKPPPRRDLGIKKEKLTGGLSCKINRLGIKLNNSLSQPVPANGVKTTQKGSR